MHSLEQRSCLGQRESDLKNSGACRVKISSGNRIDRGFGFTSYQYARPESAHKQSLDAKSLYYLGMSCVQAKQKSQAREALDRALAAGLQGPYAAEARHTIRAVARLMRLCCPWIAEGPLEHSAPSLQLRSRATLTGPAISQS